MTALVTAKMQYLAEAFADLKTRVRLALAGELAQHVATAVADVIRAVVAGRDPVENRPPVRTWQHPDRDPWDEDDEYDPRRAERTQRDEDAEPVARAAKAAVPLAVAAGIHTVRWWLGRKGHLLGAICAGLGIGFLGLAGGPLVRSALAALTAAADLLAVTDALGDSAARLEPI